jgi:3-methyladenine DNA glycosylase AlkD
VTQDPGPMGTLDVGIERAGKDRRDAAVGLGRDLAEFVPDPDAFASALRDGLSRFADPDVRAGTDRVAPGIGPTLGVTWPTLAAISRGLRAGTRRDSPSSLLFVADRLFREPVLEPRWIAFGLLEDLVAAEPERAWQLLRRGSREAGDWITVDTLAHPYGRGILLEAYRWAELEQLVYAPSRWERRLVGSTIATIPYVDRRLGRAPDVARRGVELVGLLIGDSEEIVQKALSWALRSLVLVDPSAVEAFLDREAATAVAQRDGHRAWVIRDTLPKLDPALATALRERLSGIRRSSAAASTSEAADTARRFVSLGLGRQTAEPPLR